MIGEPDLRDVPPLPLHIWPQATHADAARSVCPCCCCRGFGGLGLVQVNTGDYARVRVFVIAQLIHMSLLDMLPRRAPRTAGQFECRTPH